MHEQPLLGVMLPPDVLKEMEQGSIRPRMGMLNAAAVEAGVSVVFFSMEGVDLENRQINCIRYNQQAERWCQGVAVYPRVFYKRSGNGPSNRKFDKFIRQLKASGARFLNYPFPYPKMEVYNKLYKNKSVRPYLPETVQLSGPRILEMMLNRYGDVYVKASLGSRGKRVVRIKAIAPRCYRLTYFDDQPETVVYRNLSKMIQDLERMALYRDVLVQPAIDLIKVNGRLVDFRAEVQRTGDGQIVAYAIPVRVGSSASPITTHASSYQMEEFLTKFLNYETSDVSALRNRVEEFLVKIYRAIEQSYGQCGEMGIDFGLDTTGKLWFIETNSRSAKVSLFHSYDEATINRHFQTLVQYAVSIAGDVNEPSEE
ncbi:MAG: YheC/YheD family protein [Firmicutes bacterium]|nr:YheC/YheD family protein [Bacillota bacterium]